jgi:DNA mismatch repair protein MutS
MEIDMDKLSPMMQQYFAIKEKHKDHILFSVSATFMNMFTMTPLCSARELELTLTGKSAGRKNVRLCAVCPIMPATFIYPADQKGYKVCYLRADGKSCAARGVVCGRSSGW